MNLNEANEILENTGYIIEGSMSLKDKMANAEKQLTYIKLKVVADLLDSYKCSYTFNDNDEFYQLYLRTSFNSFKINYNDNLDCYDIYYMFEEGYESFKTAEELVNWIFEDEESMQLDEAKQILKDAGYLVEESKDIPKMDKLQELQLKEMLIDFWPFYSGAVDVGKSGLSSNPKAQRRYDKICDYAETIFGDDAYYVVQGFNIHFQNVEKQIEDKLWEDNVNNVQRWKSDRCNGAIMQLAKMSLNDTIEAIKKADLNKLAEKEIDKWSH